jgi:hypothetical protein
MPYHLPREENADELAQLGADPDLRGRVAVDGLVINGRDPLAARRRMMRERQTGRPDPAPSIVENKKGPIS